MGGGQSKTDPNNEKQSTHTTLAPTVTPTPCSNKELHLALAFLAGILVTLLLLAVVFIIVKSYKKSLVASHSSPQDLDPHSDSLAKLSPIPEEALTYANMTFKLSEGKRDDLFANHPLDLNSVVYAQIKETNSP